MRNKLDTISEQDKVELLNAFRTILVFKKLLIEAEGAFDEKLMATFRQFPSEPYDWTEDSMPRAIEDIAYALRRGKTLDEVATMEIMMDLIAKPFIAGKAEVDSRTCFWCQRLQERALKACTQLKALISKPFE